jgi:hypothetical protein
LARRVAAVLSVAAMLGLGGLMYWTDHQGTAGAATGSTQGTTQGTTSQSTTRSASERESDDTSSGSSGTSQWQTVPAPHTNTRGS